MTDPTPRRLLEVARAAAEEAGARAMRWLREPPPPETKSDGTLVRSLWGEMAWQLGAAAGFAIVAESD